MTSRARRQIALVKLQRDIDLMFSRSTWRDDVSCNRCGSNVYKWNKYRHWQWHRGHMLQAARARIMHETVKILWGDHGD